jgi:HK97 gp10 family phage protein
MAIGALVTMNVRAGAALLEVKSTILQATQDTFELDIVPTAKALSPVTEEGYQRNLELKAEHKLGGRRAMGTGTNRRSIDSVVNDSPDGPVAELFTQSGYGGYLELGTSRMRAQPYLYPAFEMHIGQLAARVKDDLGG